MMPRGPYFFANGQPRVDLGWIMPEFIIRVSTALARAADRGQAYYATRGFARWAQQHRLYLNYLNGVGGRAAPAGLSAHEYGIALDFAADASPAPGLQPTWKAASYDILGEEVQRVGLVWGAAFNDRPHVQWPGFVSAAQLRPLKNILRGRYDKQLLEKVWEYIRLNSPLEKP